ncbi:unnamed protein product [Phytomonas sp. EM1]|nr:unnamed protein product [Phytomonas sp. EM1]|eukprot:CCW61122.1 unnamed protein product [Phytomonas sp. isolate EM1]
MIKDDPSISRTHLSFEIDPLPLQHIIRCNSSLQSDAVDSENPNGPNCDRTLMSFDAQDAACVTPASITLIDSSTYGSTAIALVSETDPSGLKASLATASPFQSEELSVIDFLKRNRVAANIPDRASSSVAHSKPMLVTPDDTTHVVQEKHRLIKGTPFRVPLDRLSWRQFALVLGNHGATLVFAWVDLYALVENIDENERTMLERELNHCGVQLLASPRSYGYCTNALVKTNFFVSSFFEPTPQTLAILCRMTPVVLPSFFSAILNRATPQVPLPDPCCYLPPVSSSWRRFTSPTDSPAFSSNSNSLISISSDFLKPNIQRRDLFAGFSFVVLRQTLLDEIAFFVECAKGCVMLDDSLKTMTSFPIAHAHLVSFAERHKGHVVVLKMVDKDELEEFIMALNDQNLVQCIDYDKLVRCVVLAEPLSLTIYRDTSSGLSRHESKTEKGKWDTGADLPSSRNSSNGRKTDAIPVFPSLNSLEGKANSGYEQISSAMARGTERFVDTHGWITRRNVCSTTTDSSETLNNCVQHFGDTIMAGRVASLRRTRDEIGDVGVSHDHAGEFACNKLELPLYPCFQAHRREDASDTGASLVRFVGGQFSKQYVEAPSCPSVELDMSFLGAPETDASSSRLLDLATSDIIPDRRAIARSLVGGRDPFQHTSSWLNSEVLVVGGVAAMVGTFNAFDTAAHNSINKKRGTVVKKRVQAEGSRNGAWNTRRTATSTDTGMNHKSLLPFLSTSHAPCIKTDASATVDGDEHRSEYQNSTCGVFPVDSTHNDFDIFDIDGIF